MSEIEKLSLAVPAGYSSAEVALLIAQMDDQLRLQTEGTRQLTPEDLAWQPARGMNTIGMLMAHQAVVEVWWTGLALEDQQPAEVRFKELVGITLDDDGMPLAENGGPPAIFAGRNLAYFDDLLARARAHLKSVAAGIRDTDLTRTLTRTRPNGKVREIQMRWALYHMLEHFSGHFGQILLLQHARQALDTAKR